MLEGSCRSLLHTDASCANRYTGVVLALGAMLAQNAPKVSVHCTVSYLDKGQSESLQPKGESHANSECCLLWQATPESVEKQPCY